MKVSNINNLITAINNKESEVEIHGNFSDKVVRCSLISTIVYVSSVISFPCGLLALAFLVLFFILNTELLFGLSIILFCVILFALTLSLTLKASQKIPLSLAFRLHKYRLEKHKNTVILIKK